jgi:hypothetical protein
MELGYIPDNTYGGIPSSWVEGAHEKRWFGMLKGRRILGITMYRCTSCGYLEGYAA